MPEGDEPSFPPPAIASPTPTPSNAEVWAVAWLERAYIEGWVLSLTFGTEEELRGGHIATGLICLVMSILGQIVVVRWPSVRRYLDQRAPRFTRKFSEIVSDPRWWIATLMVFLLYLAASPYVEEKKWPLSGWLPDVATLTSERDAAKRDAANEKVALKATEQKLAEKERELEAAKTAAVPSFTFSSPVTTSGVPTLSFGTTTTAPLTDTSVDQKNIIGSVHLRYNEYAQSLDLLSNDKIIADINIQREKTNLTGMVLPIFYTKISFSSAEGPFDVRTSMESDGYQAPLTGLSFSTRYEVIDNSSSYINMRFDFSNRQPGLLLNPNDITVTFYKRNK